MKISRRVIAEPFVQFLALGAIIFALFGAVDDRSASQNRETITVTSARIEQLRNGFVRVWSREPTGEELDGLIADFVRGEVLYREALALGLDRDDPIIRNRLRYKLEFLADSGAQLMEPDDQTLIAFMTDNAGKYAIGPRLAVRQIYLGEDPSGHEIEAAAAAAGATGAGPGWRELGERSLLPAEIGVADHRTVDDVFGAGFFDLVAALPPGAWSGPVRSGFGFHLALAAEREPGRAPELSEIRDAVLRDWRIERAEELKQAQFDTLRARYLVNIADRSAE